MTPSRTTTGLVALVLAFSLAGCATSPQIVASDGEPGPRERAASPSTGDEDPGPEDTAGTDFEEAFAERDQFIADQQQPLDGSLLAAKTPAQHEFIDAQRAHAEAQGAQWGPQIESISLALALDACETSILNGHAVDLQTFRMHVMSSPLIQQVAGDDQAARDGAVGIAVFGTGFLCPDDAPQWEAAWEESGGVYE